MYPASRFTKYRAISLDLNLLINEESNGIKLMSWGMLFVYQHELDGN
jgi:hypothetical protein